MVKNTPPLSATGVQGQRLANVAYIRLVLVVLLVFYHAFAIFGGAWEPIDGFADNQVYWWMDWLSYACMLESFVFVSGYVFGFQVRTKGEVKLKAGNLFLNKAKRLMLPCAIFSLLYLLIFEDITQPVGETLYDLVNGVAHMWFLPMLFWCFVLIWIIEKIRMKPRYVIPILVILSLFSVNGLPLQLSNTFYYMVFFYVGYALQRYDVSLDKYYTKRNAIISVLVFVVLFVSLTLLKENRDSIFTSPSLAVQTAKFITGRICMLGYSGAGVIMLLTVFGYMLKGTDGRVPGIVVEIGNLCFGVYLFQQFILKAIYYYTDMPSFWGAVFTPWVGFVIALIGSLLLTWLCRLTSVGRSVL